MKTISMTKEGKVKVNIKMAMHDALMKRITKKIIDPIAAKYADSPIFRLGGRARVKMEKMDKCNFHLWEHKDHLKGQVGIILDFYYDEESVGLGWSPWVYTVVFDLDKGATFLVHEEWMTRMNKKTIPRRRKFNAKNGAGPLRDFGVHEINVSMRRY